MPMIEELVHLRAPFEPADIEWSPIFTKLDDGGDPLIYVSPYVKRLAVINRLNQVCGITGWATDARSADGHLAVGVGILVERRMTRYVEGKPVDETRSEWVWRWDGTGYLEASGDHFTAADAGKGDFTNAFKRVTIQWGIGLDLKEVRPMKAIINERGRYKAKIGTRFYKWDPPDLRGNPSRPGEIAGLKGAGGDDTNAPRHQDPVEPPKGPSPVEVEEMIQQAKNKVRNFMQRSHLQLYHLDAVIITHPKLKHRAPNGGLQLGKIGTLPDWEILVDHTVNAKRTRWDEAPKELAKEFPASDERVAELRALMKAKRPNGQEAVVIESAISCGWNDAVEHWIEELSSR